MPDKHEVGGSSPLEPTETFSLREKVSEVSLRKTSASLADAIIELHRDLKERFK